MNLLLLRNDPRNDILRQEDGTSLYRFQTPYPDSEELDTQICKFTDGHAQTIGCIKRPSYEGDSVFVGEQRLYVETHTFFNGSVSIVHSWCIIISDIPSKDTERSAHQTGNYIGGRERIKS